MTLKNSFFRFLAALLLAHLPMLALSDTEYIGVFLQDQRIGAIIATTRPTSDGRYSVVTTKFGARLLGQEAILEVVSESWSDSTGRLTKQNVRMESAGRKSQIKALYGKDKITVTRESEGERFTKTIEVPQDGSLVDDPVVTLLQKGKPEARTKAVIYVLDPTMLSLVRNEVEWKGEKEITFGGQERKALWLQIKDPRFTSDMFLDPKGELIYATSVFGMQLRPISREEALGTNQYIPSIDLATASSVRPDKPLIEPDKILKLTLRLEGADLPLLSSSSHQTVKRDSNGILLTIHPYYGSEKSAGTLATVKKEFTEYTRAEPQMPVNSPAIKKLAKQIIGKETNAFKAALLINKYVHKIMKPNASIAVMRNAEEILKTKEGVCRDYAVLAATLMRSIGIPARLATGLVYWNDGFYYHMWVEAYTGTGWHAFDPTQGKERISATYIKLASGNPDKAMEVYTLDGVKITVLEQVPAPKEVRR
ncbi:MAG TPA: transglutaminase-like domain-containing protein [Fimbriimonadales bacterium]|nr:transglutaminase-like domain-containing protein [Fimbriimonadales bacterium]